MKSGISTLNTHVLRMKTMLCTALLFFSFQSNSAEMQIMLKHEDYNTPAILNLPGNRQPVGAVLMLHGTASHKNEVGNLFQRLAARLSEEGIASLRIDFAGTGDSPVSYMDYTLESAVRDAQSALDYLMKEQGITRTGVLGFSQGGLIAQLLINNNNDLPALALWSSVTGDGTTAMQSWFDGLYPQAVEDGYVTLTFPWRSDLKLSRDWFEQLKAQRSLTGMKAYRGHVLAVSGSADDVVPYTSTAVLRLFPFASFDTITIKDGTHIFNALDNDQTKAEQVLEITSDWFVRVFPAQVE